MSQVPVASAMHCYWLLLKLLLRLLLLLWLPLLPLLLRAAAAAAARGGALGQESCTVLLNIGSALIEVTVNNKPHCVLLVMIMMTTTMLLYNTAIRALFFISHAD